MRKSLTLVAIFLTLACSPAKPPVVVPTPVPTPTPTPCASGTCTTGIPVVCVCDDPAPVACPPGTPDFAKYNVKCRDKAGEENRFCDATPLVHDLVYCAPDADCPYKGGEGSDLRKACEVALALPVWVQGKQRDDNPFSADVLTGTEYIVCHQGLAGPTAPCANGVAN